jgi:hypothetical protein
MLPPFTFVFVFIVGSFVLEDCLEWLTHGLGVRGADRTSSKAGLQVRRGLHGYQAFTVPGMSLPLTALPPFTFVFVFMVGSWGRCGVQAGY